MAQSGVHKTVYVEVQGKTGFASLRNPDQYGKRTLKLYPDQESLTKLKKVKDGWYEDTEGVKNDLIRLDDGGEHVWLSRKDVHETRFKTIALGPPKVVDKNGVPYEGLIGNGSDVTCTLELYFYKNPSKKKEQASAMRLQSIRIDNLVEYNPQRDMSDEDKARLPRSAPPQW